MKGRELINLPDCAATDHEGVLLNLQASSADDSFEPLLGVEEAAALLKIHPKTLQALCRAGTIPCARLGKYWRFRASALDSWVAHRLQFDHQSRCMSRERDNLEAHAR